MEWAVRTAPDAALDYADHRGAIELRTALSEYLGRVRGVRVDPSRIIIAQGFTQALDLLCRVLVNRGATKLAMESPSHPGLWATVRGSGLELVGCPVDSEGPRPALGPRAVAWIRPPARARASSRLSRPSPQYSVSGIHARQPERELRAEYCDDHEASAAAEPIPEVPPVIRAFLSRRFIVDVPSVTGTSSPFTLAPTLA